MYGTMFRMKIKAENEGAIGALFEEWERRPKVAGAIAGFILKPDNSPGELVGFGVFKDKASHLANADDPEQHEWYMKLRGLLEADPTWEDGEYIAGTLS